MNLSTETSVRNVALIAWNVTQDLTNVKCVLQVLHLTHKVVLVLIMILVSSPILMDYVNRVAALVQHVMTLQNARHARLDSKRVTLSVYSVQVMNT